MFALTLNLKESFCLHIFLTFHQFKAIAFCCKQKQQYSYLKVRLLFLPLREAWPDGDPQPETDESLREHYFWPERALISNTYSKETGAFPWQSLDTRPKWAWTLEQLRGVSRMRQQLQVDSRASILATKLQPLSNREKYAVISNWSLKGKIWITSHL